MPPKTLHPIEPPLPVNQPVVTLSPEEIALQLKALQQEWKKVYEGTFSNEGYAIKRQLFFNHFLRSPKEVRDLLLVDQVQKAKEYYDHDKERRQFQDIDFCKY